MEFNRIPDDVLLQIIQYLPLNEQVRFGYVSKRCYYDLSTAAISKSKYVDLRGPVYKKLDPDAFNWLLGLNYKNLERLNFPEITDPAMIDVFSRFVCPKLIELDLGETHFGNPIFERVIRNCANLRIFTYDFHEQAMPWPADVISENLREIHIGFGNDRSLASITGHVPNLEHFEASYCKARPNAWDAFIASCPNINTFICRTEYGRYDRSRSFWKLKLRKLELVHESWDVIPRIAATFMDLEILDYTSRIHLPLIPESALIQVSWMNKLKELTMRGDKYSTAGSGYRELFKFKNTLRKLTISADLGHYFYSVVMGWTKLEYLCIGSIRGVETVEHAAKVASTFKRYRRNCTDLTIYIEDRKQAEIWKSREVKEVLKMLSENGHAMINFE